jgi:hypothetical protein
MKKKELEKELEEIKNVLEGYKLYYTHKLEALENVLSAVSHVAYIRKNESYKKHEKDEHRVKELEDTLELIMEVIRAVINRYEYWLHKGKANVI